MIVIQARMESTRLPGKILLDLGGAPVLHWVVAEAVAAKVGRVVVALPDTPGNDHINLNVEIALGPHHDVAERFRRVVDEDMFVRLCADSPFVDRYTIRNVVATLRGSTANYCIGGEPGRQAQAVMTEAWLEVLPRMSPAEREHVIPEWFGPRIEPAPFTLDTSEDYERLKGIL